MRPPCNLDAKCTPDTRQDSRPHAAVYWRIWQTIEATLACLSDGHQYAAGSSCTAEGEAEYAVALDADRMARDMVPDIKGMADASA
jgi:hypothetical protein